MNKEKEKYRMLQTKVSPEVYALIERIQRKCGISAYQLIQMMCDAIVRYMDDRHNLSPELNRVIMLFEHLAGWGEALNLADPNAAKEVAAAFYVMQSADGDHKGLRLVKVNRPYMGKWDATYNLQLIFEDFLRVSMPGRYKRLRALAIEEGCNSLLDLLDHLIDFHTSEQEARELRRPFEDANRAGNNRPVEYGQPTRRKHHYDIDSPRAQRTITFNNEPETE